VRCPRKEGIDAAIDAGEGLDSPRMGGKGEGGEETRRRADPLPKNALTRPSPRWRRGGLGGKRKEKSWAGKISGLSKDQPSYRGGDGKALLAWDNVEGGKGEKTKKEEEQLSGGGGPVGY